MSFTDIEEQDLLTRLVQARRGHPTTTQAPAYRPGDPFTRGIVRGTLRTLGLPMDLLTGIHNLSAKTQPGMKPIEKPIMGSDWLVEKLGPEPEPEFTADLPSKMMSQAGEFSGDFLTGLGLSKLRPLVNSRLAQGLLGNMTAGQAAKLGVLSGVGSAVGEEYAGPLGSAAGMLGGPVVGSAALRQGLQMAPLLANERGAMSISPSALSSAWQSTVGSKLTSLGQKLGSIGLTSRNSKFSNWMGGNTLNEWALSPLERMDQDAAQLFRNARAEAQRTGEALKSTAIQLKNLNMEERESLREVLKYNFNIAKATPGTQAKISSLLQPVADANVTTQRKLYTTPQQAMVVEDHLDDALMKIFQEDATMGNWQLLKQNTQHDLTTPKGTLAFLDDVMRNKLYPPEVKRLALDYYDLPAKTAFEVGDAHRKAYEQLLYHEIVNNPKFSVLQADFLNQIHQAQLTGNTTLLKQLNKQLDDFVVIAGENDPALGDRIVIPSLSKAFDGLYVHRDVAEGLRDLNTHITNLRLGWNKYFLNPWKMSKVVLQVPARLRDLINNFMFNDIYGKNPLSPFRLDVYGGALNDIRRAAKGQKIPELESYFYHTGGKMDALNSVATDPIFAAMKHDAGILDNLLGYFYSNPVSSAMSGIIRNIDFWAKYSKYKHNLASGKFGSEEEAIVDALRATGNMMEQPRAIRNVRDTILPFFGWTAHAAKTVARGLVDHPIRTAKWYLGPVLAGQYAVGELGMTNQEYEDFKSQLPEYMQSQPFGIPSRIPLPWRDEKGRIQMMDIGWWLPGVQDFAEMDSAWDNPLRVVQNPAATLFASLVSNKKFSGAPIYNEWDDPGTKWAKRLGYTAQQIMPPLTPVVGTQASKMWEAYKNEDPDAPTMAQALGTQIGARIQPVDQDQAYLKNQARLRAWQNEAKHQMREELSETADPAEQEAVVNKYQNILNRLQAEEAGVEEEE